MAAVGSGEVSKTGRCLSILQPGSCKIRSIDEDALARILLDSRVRKSKLMVVSVGGLGRKGNSFLLNIFLRYLQTSGKPDWDDPYVPLKGFPSRTVPDFFGRITVGSLMWSEPFFITIPSGEEICILLMDTSGDFNYYNKAMAQAETDRFRIFNALVSSVFICSTHSICDSKANLKYIARYGKLALKVYERKPYQTFYFLVRDWGSPNMKEVEHYPLGFMSDSDLRTELKNINLPLSECFEDLCCYTMPHPKCYLSDNCEWYLSDIRPAFKNSLKVLTEHLFNPENVVVKEINGKQLTGMELFLYIKSYIEVLHGCYPSRTDLEVAARRVIRKVKKDKRCKNIPVKIREEFKEAATDEIRRIKIFRKRVKSKEKLIPDPWELIEATDKARKMIAEIGDVYFCKFGLVEAIEDNSWDIIGVDKAVELYSRDMKEFMYGKDMHHISGLLLEEYHGICCERAFLKLRRMGLVDKIYKDELDRRICELHDNFVKEFRICRKDLDPIKCEKVESKLSEMAVNGNKKDIAAELILATLSLKAEPTLSEDKKNN